MPDKESDIKPHPNLKNNAVSHVEPVKKIFHLFKLGALYVLNYLISTLFLDSGAKYINHFSIFRNRTFL
jgi:hypothetical protein